MNVPKSSQVINYIRVELKPNIFKTCCVSIIIVDVGNDIKLLIYVSTCSASSLLAHSATGGWNQMNVERLVDSSIHWGKR
jgi:hypothetical protein